jgi:hypothetical protein
MIVFDCAPVEPVRITSRYGPRNTGLTGASTYHKGIDMGINKTLSETPVLAVRDGTVSKNYWDNTRGWALTYDCMSDDGERFRVLVQHLREQSRLKIGQTIAAGQKIGFMGASTKTIKNMAVHLHMELQILVSGVWTPIDFLHQLEHIGEDEMTEQRVREIFKEELSKSNETPSPWAAKEWEQAKKDGVTDGSRPQAIPTREQTVVMLYRMLDGIKKA